MKPFVLFVLTWLLTASSLSAHPTGHEGGFFETVRHFMTHPDHFLAWGLVALLGGWLLWKAIRFRRNQVKTETIEKR